MSAREVPAESEEGMTTREKLVAMFYDESYTTSTTASKDWAERTADAILAITESECRERERKAWEDCFEYLSGMRVMTECDKTLMKAEARRRYGEVSQG